MSTHLYTLFVPVAPRHDIAARSAILASADQAGDQRLCYFEGDIYGASNLARYSDRVRCAASRAVDRYPTVAMSVLPTASLRNVGTYDARSRRITAINDPDALRAYLSPEPLPEILTAEVARLRVETALGRLGTVAMNGPALDRLHAWTGRVKQQADAMLLECVAEQGDELQWLAGLRYLPGNLVHGLRDLLDREDFE